MIDSQIYENSELLLRMARDKTQENNQRLLAAISDLFCGRTEVLSDRERAHMSSILRQMLHEAEMSVRRKLAMHLSSLRKASNDLVMELTNDEIEVAYPILIKCGILRDTDLVEMIQHRTLQHQLAIAMRKDLRENQADASAKSSDDDIIGMLLKNLNARISNTTMQYLVEESKRVDTYHDPLLRWSELSPELSKRIYWWVSAALREHIVTRFATDLPELDATIEQTVTEVIAAERVVRLTSSPDAVAEELDKEDKITGGLMVRVVRQGEVPLFEAMFARRSGLRLRLVRRLLFEPGGEGFAVVCRAIDIARKDCAALFLMTRKARPGSGEIKPRDITRVLEIYDEVDPKVARAVIDRWRRDSNYLNALRQLEEKRNAQNRESSV